MENKKKLSLFGIPYLMRFIKPHIKLMVIIILFMGAGSLLESVFPLFQNYAINHFVGEQILDTLPAFIGLYVLMLLVQGIMNGIGMYASAIAEVRVGRDIRQACFEHIQTLSMSYFHNNSVGYIHSRIISDPDRIGVLISWSLMDITIDIFYLIGIFFIMTKLSLPLSLLLLCMVPVEIGVTWAFQKYIASAGRVVREQNGVITGRFNEGIIGAGTIRALCIGNKMSGEFRQETEKMARAGIRFGHFRALYNSAIVFCAGTAMALVLWRGGMLTQQRLIMVGTLSVFMNYALSISAYVQALVNTISNLVNTQVNIERVADLLSAEPDVLDTPEVIEKYGDSFHPKLENWEDVHGDYELKDVTFRYPGTEVNVLEHFNLKIPKGSMTAIVGETGAGKSTLVNLLCRFYEPVSGNIYLDGKDLRERSQLWLHRHIGYVLQTPYLFDDTIRANLCYGSHNEHSDAELMEVLKKIGADGIVTKYETGLDTRVGEGGSLLSTGEKQMLSFARALASDPDILVLDEATSSIDTISERAIQHAMEELVKDRTSIVIAHRLSTIRNADIILVMKDGQVVEQGNHQDLMAAEGHYYELCMRQNGQ